MGNIACDILSYHLPVFQFVYYISTNFSIHPTRLQCVNRDSSVDIVTKLRDGCSRNRGSTPGEAEVLNILQSVQTDPGTQRDT